MKTTSLQLIRRLFVAAVLGIFASAFNAQAAPGAAGHSMQARHCLDQDADGHRHARRHETSVKGLVLEEIACETEDFDRDGMYETHCSTTTHTYDEKGNLIAQLELYDYGNDGVVDGQLQRTWTYDARGHVLTEIGMNSVFIGERFISTYAYDRKGNLITRADLFDRNGNGIFDLGEPTGNEPNSSTINTYDRKGRLVLVQRDDDNEGDGIINSFSTIQYVY